jgi:lipoprotein-anchoring transpeptidase ErfK/SrfK
MPDFEKEDWVLGRSRRRRRRTRAVWILLLVAGVLVGLAGGAAFAGYRYDQNRLDRLMPGVRIAGVDVGGMTRSEAEQALRPAVATILDRQIQVEAAGKTWNLTAGELGTEVDVQRPLDQAFAASNGMPWTSRLIHRLLDRPLLRSFQLGVAYHRDVVARFVKGVGRSVQLAPTAAELDFADGQLMVRHSKAGRALNAKVAVGSLFDALQRQIDAVALTTRTIRPTVSDQTLGMTIIVRLSQNRLYLYKGLELVKTFPVATGQPQYPTPTGHWTIVNKRINPTWYNPAKDTWGAGEPDFIPPGPDNPLGTRALDLDAPGIRIHGTPNDASIGTYASHGCIRMHIPDSEQLFDLVPVGTPVIIAF